MGERVILVGSKLQITTLCFTWKYAQDFCWLQATGGGAYKYADLFKEKLGVILDKEDEMDCLVAGANFLLKVRNCDCIRDIV